MHHSSMTLYSTGNLGLAAMRSLAIYAIACVGCLAEQSMRCMRLSCSGELQLLCKVLVYGDDDK